MNSAASLSRIKFEIDQIPHLDWANQFNFTIPRALAHYLYERMTHNQLTPQLLNQISKKLTQAALEEVRLQAAFTNTQPLSSRLPINYQLVPSLLRDVIAKWIGRIKRSQIDRWANFPIWPLDLSADFIADLGGHEPSPYASGPTPVMLTHDLDSPEGLKNAVNYFIELEEAVGARSANYVVPQSWPIDHGYLEEIFQRGHEVGIHGFDHSNKTPFLTPAEQNIRLSMSQPLIDRYQIAGYRAPSLLRTKSLLQNLAKIYRYDSSIPTAGGAFPVPNNGCATARPFRVEGIWEIPLSMPRDGSLLFLGFSPKNILKMWIECAEMISKSGGVINLLTHCENRFSGKRVMRDIYKQFLEYLANHSKYQFTLPKDIQLQGH